MSRFKRYSPSDETEATIQVKLFNDLVDKNKYILPNIFLYGWESDLISVAYSNYVSEYEIKISRSDFFADFRKRKHNWLFRRRAFIPNRFWYVAPEGLIKESEIPGYSGFIEINGAPNVVKRAPLLNKDKMPGKFKHHMIRSAMYKINNFKVKLNGQI